MRLLLVVLAVFLVLVPMVSNAMATNWGLYKYDQGNTGYYPVASRSRIVDFRLVKVFTAGLCLASNPLLIDVNHDGVLDAVVPSCDGYTYAVSLSNGRVIWKAKTGLGLVGAALVEGPAGYIVVVPGPGVLYGLNASTGATVWHLKGLFYTTIPDVVEDAGEKVIVANSMDGKLYYISPAGKVEAVVKLSDKSLNPPAVGDVTGDGKDDVAVASRDGVLYLVDSSGKVYGLRLAGGTLSTPTIYNGTIYVVAGGEAYAVGFNGTGLYVEWARRVDGDSHTSPSIGDVDNDRAPEVVFTVSGGIYIYSLEGELKYEFKGIDASYGGVIIADVDGDGRNEMIVARYDYKLEILDLSLGDGDYISSLEYSVELGGPIMAPPSLGDVYGNGTLDMVVACRDFNLYILRPVVEHTPLSHTHSTEANNESPGTTTWLQPTGSSGPGGNEGSSRELALASLAAGIAILLAIVVLGVKHGSSR